MHLLVIVLGIFGDGLHARADIGARFRRQVASRAEVKNAEVKNAEERRIDSRSKKKVSPKKVEKFGLFFEAEPYSELQFPSHLWPKKTSPNYPLFSLKKGTFCWLEDARCDFALILDADIGAGVNVVRFTRGFDLPHSQWRVRAGWSTHLMRVANRSARDWHPWGLGLVGSWSVGSPTLVVGRSVGKDGVVGKDSDGKTIELSPIQSWRIGVVNQIWLQNRNFSPHLDLTVGTIYSSILDFPGRFWGSHVEVAYAWGGWGGFFLAADFLDRDTRFLGGFRAHGIAALPISALLVMGVAAAGGLR